MRPAAPARKKPNPRRGRSPSSSIFKSEDGSFRVRLQFRKSHVSDEELAAALRTVLRRIESGSLSSSAA